MNSGLPTCKQRVGVDAVGMVECKSNRLQFTNGRVIPSSVCLTCHVVDMENRDKAEGEKRKQSAIRDRSELELMAAGVGTELHSLLLRIGFVITSSCKCLEHIKRMNKLGVAWCRENTEEILGWIKSEASRRKVPFVRLAVLGLVKLAIYKASKAEEDLRQATKETYKIKWAYGITTVPERIDDLFPGTLNSLKNAGFESPHVFVDGGSDLTAYSKFDLEVTLRGSQNVRTAGNWVLSLYELYIRNPTADRYAIFQDDFVTYKNLREYLEKCEFPSHGYWNLYTFPANQELAPDQESVGWYLSNQYGRGAVALVFSLEGVTKLLTSQHMIMRPQDPRRGWRAVDGGVVTALKKEGWKEYVHNPSLVQHTGDISAMRNKPHKKAESFRGEEFDAMELLKCQRYKVID